MPTWSRAFRPSLFVAALVALAPPAAGAPLVTGASTAVAPAVATASGQVHRVGYHGVFLDVPAAWPVIDLQSQPTACLRLDRNAVYLGDPAPQQDCPAHAVGHADAMWLHPNAQLPSAAMASPPTKVGSLTAHVVSDPVAHAKQVLFPNQHVELDASWAVGSGTVQTALATVSSTAAPPTTPAPAATSAAPAATSAAPAALQVSRSAPTSSPAPSGAPHAALSAPRGVRDNSSFALMSATTSAASTFTGMGFDTCAAPAASTMKAWLSSPYRSLGIYIGGSMRACADGNLSSSWVSTVKSMGWGLAPIYVGVQAPCVDQSGLATIDPSQAAAEGTASADDAVNRVQYFGLAVGTPIYYDMEGYNSSVAGCSATVLTFISAWSSELRSRGYTSGAYGSSDSLMTDMSHAMGTSGFVPPADVWFAHWNGLQNTTDSASFSGFSDAYWANHQRMHQYTGNGNETWGGVSINLDADWSDAAVAGAAVPVDYGTNVLGPGSAGFVFTGSMAYWRPNPPQGLKGMAYWTYSSGPTEYNGATWSPRLPPGLYNVQAYVPGSNATATVPYTVRYAGGTAVRTVNQAVTSGYTSLGTYLANSSTSISVHVGDNDGSSTTTQLGVDAMAFQLVATAPGAPGGVSAVGGDDQATVTWTAAAANGSPITAYTVTASPGGATTQVSGTATSAVVRGLSVGTTYTFSVSATNAVGTGPAARSGSVTTHAGSVGAAHDWNGDGHPDLLARDSSGRLWLYPGNGTGGWLARRQVGSGWNVMTAITAPGDFNGDGHPDVLARDSSGRLWLYPGNGTGGWLAARQVGSGWNVMTAMTAPGDFNGDGHPDVLARDSSGSLWLYPGNGTGGWLARRQVGSGWNIMTAMT